MEDAHAREVGDVLSYFGTDVHTGLSDFGVSKVCSTAVPSQHLKYLILVVMDSI